VQSAPKGVSAAVPVNETAFARSVPIAFSPGAWGRQWPRTAVATQARVSCTAGPRPNSATRSTTDTASGSRRLASASVRPAMTRTDTPPYFGDKQGLFDRVIHNAVIRFDGAVQIEDDDLAAYVGRLVDHFSSHPEDLRLLGWARVDEQCEQGLWARPVTAHRLEKIAAVRRAQVAGTVDQTWDPKELLKLVLALATYWASASEPTDSPAARRALVGLAVSRVIAAQQAVEPLAKGPDGTATDETVGS